MVNSFYSARETNGISINRDLLAPMNTSLSNQTFLHTEFSVTVKILLGLPYATALVLGVIGNIMAILTIVLHEKMRNTMNLFLLNLSFSDLLVTGICMPAIFGYQIVSYPHWQFGKYSCKIFNYLVQVSVLCSVLTLISIATHRYFILIHGNQTFVYPTKRIKALLIATWIIAASCTVPTFLSSQAMTITFQGVAKNQCIEVHDSKIIETIILWFRAITYIGTVGLLGCTYARMVIFLASQKYASTSTASLKKNQTKKRRIINMLVTATATFVIGWLPYVVLVFFNLYPPWKGYKLPTGVYIFASFSGMANSIIDPYIYCYFNPKFRRGFISIVTKIRGAFTCMTGKIGNMSGSYDVNTEERAAESSL